MIISLVGIAPLPSAALSALASHLEAQDSALQVRVLEAPAEGWGGGRSDGANLSGGRFDLLLEGEPDLMVVLVTPANAGPVRSLSRRLRALERGPALWLLGIEASGPGGRPPPADRGGGASGDGQARVEELLQRLLDGAPWAVPVPLDRTLERLFPGPGKASPPVWVGSLWTDQVPLPLARHLRVMAPPWPPSADLPALTRALLRGGRAVHLSDPGFCSSPASLSALLASLEADAARHLTLELPVEALDDGFLAAAAQARPRALKLDLAAVGDGSLAPGGVQERVARLADLGVAAEGTLVYGLPGQDLRLAAESIHRCLLTGVDRVRFQRLQVPPGSRLSGPAAQAGLAWNPDPPHEVLPGPTLGPAEHARLARVAELWSWAGEQLAGTGMPLLLARRTGDAFAMLEELAEELTLDGFDPLLGRAPPPAHRRLSGFMRRQLGIGPLRAQGSVALRRAPGLTLRWLEDGCRRVIDEDTGKAAHLGRRALQVLDHFEGAMSEHEALESMLRGVADAGERRRRLRELKATASKLSTMGFLVPVEPPPGAVRRMAHGDEVETAFHSLEEFEYHRRMLADEQRAGAYKEAILRAVAPGQHVVEVGTGTGILAVWAAQAGARVTAIERYAVIEAARQVVQDSGVARRVRLLRGRADLVELEEPGDLLVFELVGNRILDEGLLETAIDARRRLLRPGAAMVPGAIEILVQLGWTDRFEGLEQQLAVMSGAYGARLDALWRWVAARRRARRLVWELGAEEQDFRTLSREQPVLRLDLARLEEAAFSRRVEIQPQAAGEVNAALLSFRLELLPGGPTLSTCGRNHGLHWSRPVHMLSTRVCCRPGQPVALRVAYEEHGVLTVELDTQQEE